MTSNIEKNDLLCIFEYILKPKTGLEFVRLYYMNS